MPAINPDPRADFRRSNMRAAVLIGGAAVVLGVLAGFFNPLLNHAASVEGATVDTLFSVMLGVATAVFVVVEGVLIYSIVAFRGHGGDDDEENEGLPIRGHTGLEILWTAIPAALVTATAIGAYLVLVSGEAPQRNAFTVEVTGRQFAWQFYYPSLDVTSNELHVPVGQQILLKLHSADVIHQFWVPAFRLKRDVMPDRVTEVRFTANAPGTYPIVCTKICGAGHALMRSNVAAEDSGKFATWISGQSNGQTQLAHANDPLARGRQIFTQNGCNACHKLTDAKASGAVGPSLDGMGSRADQAIHDPGYKGQARTGEDYIRESIVAPNAYIAPGFQANIMPQGFGTQIPKDDLDALVKYLAAQK